MAPVNSPIKPENINPPITPRKMTSIGTAAPLPNNIGSTDMQTAYTTWKATYVESTCSNGSARIRFDDPAYTVSEGIAYGMLLSAYANDQELFDGLWSYYQIN